MLLINIVLPSSKKKAYSGALFINDWFQPNKLSHHFSNTEGNNRSKYNPDERHNLSSMNIEKGTFLKELQILF